MSNDHNGYHPKIEQALQMAGKGDETWNSRFLWALRLLGLTLDFEGKTRGPEYPRGYPLIAPVPYESGEEYTRPSWPEGTMIIWIKIDPLRHRIVSAAVRGKDGFVVLGIRHYSHDMHMQISKMKDPNNFLQRSDEDQGFIDNLGIYHSRKEAYVIAKAAGQLINSDPRSSHLLEGNRLYSEMLY